MSKLICITLYRIFYPFLWLGFFLLSFVNKKIKAGFSIRRKVNGQWPWLNYSKHSQPVWLHCSSGEFEYAKPIIKRLKNQKPDIQILVTYFSETYSKNVQNFPGVDFACPLPWDDPFSIKNFILHHQPRCLLIARTDLWPEMLHQCYDRGIMTLLFSATLADSSIKLRRPFSDITKWLYGYISQIYSVTQQDTENLNKLADPLSIQTVGDSRFDQVLERLQNPKKLKSELNPNPPLTENFISKMGFKKTHTIEKVLVAGSTWPEDEKILLPVFSKLQSEFRFIIAPHEPIPEHIEELEHKLSKNHLTFSRYSQTEKWPMGSVLIIDQIGILADLYSWGHFAFVGGSFKKTVHSVMEPLAAGCITFVGPYHHNNREALEFKALPISNSPRDTVVQEVQNSEDLVRVLKRFCQTSESSQNQPPAQINTMTLNSLGQLVSQNKSDGVDLSLAKTEIQAQVKRRTGASDKIVTWTLSRVQR